MNNCLILLFLLCCCGNNCGSRNTGGCGSNIPDNCGCGGRESRCDARGMDRDDSCRERGFNPCPSPGSTCGCEEKNS